MKQIHIFVSIFILFIANYLYCQTDYSIEKVLKSEHLPGAVWTLVADNQIKTFSAGIKNINTREKLSPNDKIHVGSITKTILAIGILKLATENRLNIDEPITKYIPNLPIDNSWKKTNPVTIRHLLDHTSGLSDLRLWHFFSSSSNPSTPLSEFYTLNPKVLKIQEKPGELFSYSNMGYTLLGMLVEKITSQRYEKYLDENLLKTLEMYNSSFEFMTQMDTEKMNNLAMGHFEDGKIAPALSIYLRPAGQFTTTAEDMGKLIQFIINKGNIENKQIINPEYIKNLGRPQYTTAYKNGLKNGYAFGLAHRDRFGVIGLVHSGNIIGYRAMLYIFPEEKKGFFIAHNMDSETADYDAFNSVLIESLKIPKQKVNSNKGTSTKNFKDWEGYYVPIITKIEPLKLLDIIGSFTKIELKEKSIIITPFHKKNIKLIHNGKGLFQAEDRVNNSHLLYENENGKYLTTGIFTMQKINGWKISILLISFILGIIGTVIILLISITQIIKLQEKFINHPIFGIFSVASLILISICLIASKNIIFIGDENLGSRLLYLATIFLPIAVILSLTIYIKSCIDYHRKLGFWTSVILFQWCIVMLIYELIPFCTWK